MIIAVLSLAVFGQAQARAAGPVISTYVPLAGDSVTVKLDGYPWDQTTGQRIAADCQVQIFNGNTGTDLTQPAVGEASCDDWLAQNTNGEKAYTFDGLTPGSENTAAVTLYSSSGQPQTQSVLFSTPNPAPSEGGSAGGGSQPVQEPWAGIVESVSLNASNITSKTARLQLSGNPGGAPNCEIEIQQGDPSFQSGAPVIQTIPCTDWTGGPKTYPVSKLTPENKYTATVVFTDSDGSLIWWASVQFQMLPASTTSGRCKQATKHCQGSTGSKRKAFKVSLKVSCSKGKIKAAQRCGHGSNPVAVVSAGKSTPFRVCVRYPYLDDALGGALFRSVCTGWRNLKAGTAQVVPVTSALSLRSRLAKAGFSWAELTYSVQTPKSGPGASVKLRLTV